MMQAETRVYAGMVVADRQWSQWMASSQDPLPDRFFEVLDAVNEAWPEVTLEAFDICNLHENMRRLAAISRNPSRTGRGLGQGPTDLFASEFRAACDAVLGLPDAHQAMPSLPSIDELRRQDMTPSQIAVIYGLVDPNTKVPRSDLIEREIARPGSVIGEGFMTPRQKQIAERRRQIEAWMDSLPDDADRNDLSKGAWVLRYIPGEESGVVEADRPSLRECYEAGVQPLEAAVTTGLTLEQVGEAYAAWSDGEDSFEPETTEDPAWAIGLSNDDLIERARSMGLAVRSTMKRATLIQRIESVPAAMVDPDAIGDEP